MDSNLNNDYINSNANELNPIDYEFHELNDCLNEFWIKNLLLIEKCEQLLGKVNKHKTHCNVAKTVGTGVSGVGSVAMVSGVVLTPFTAGLSTLLSVGGGLATAVGAVTAIGTEFADTLLTKKFCSEVRQLAEERNICANKLSNKLSQLDAFVANNCGLICCDNDLKDTNEFGLIEMFKLMANGSVKAYKMTNNLVKLFDTIKEFRVLKVAKSVKSNANLVQNLEKSVVSLVPTEAKGLSSVAVRTTGASAGKLAFRGATAAVGLVFTVMDALSLVQDWNKTHPTIHVINTFVNELKNDAKLIQSIHTFITSAFAEQINDQLINDILSILSNTTDVYTVSSDESEDENDITIDVNDNTVFYNKR